MYIEKRKRGNATLYYLAQSYREGKKIKKIRIYLGSNLSIKEIESKRNAAESRLEIMLRDIGSISDPYKTVLSNDEKEELNTLIVNGKINIHHLSEDNWLKFTEAFTYDTNAIEGSTVSENEVKGILEKNQWPDKEKWEISETYGVAGAVSYVRKANEHLSLKLIKKLHKIVFQNSKSFAGNFRGKGKEVAVLDRYGGVVHRGAPSAQVTSLLKELVKWYDENKGNYHPLVLAAIVHNQFENIHPFEDGNGRVGRLLLINILLKHNFPPVNIELKNRKSYYAALQSYQKNQNIKPMLKLILREYKRLKTR
ncbi:Fic family protein [Candidatus Micrarchaeota archaeon]|nr:Fic family protein [Candidatus Micrarchaeota archaeon]